ncbi:MAG: 16S rRNA processing protein RimM [Candidatus Eremiobacteraeota bacterium]|nr:16S rRNA processing protein RimM [Candidatus Eremiobacteraeota bacterium]MBV8205138.1 16S rRNA processing protein RimM [Candidatus Eremiobacteraeota bacterium]MBV8264362.1 16S rRNA processing protein RimM [Candidatus Eremiobacteraeota bacterium]MBV8340253.1 16S rRNA processing protein RimM [Candidatus Eremiobacteraeota bacterium]MBV8459264.1 16S rRNA processing protein RimM [Candidatus Eremiobacteraeota bacterium]
MADELVIGRVIGPFGVRGELRLWVVDAAAVRDGLEMNFHLEKGETRRVTLASVRKHGKGLVAQLQGYHDRDAVALLKGARIAIKRTHLPRLTDNAHREADLVGLCVIDTRLGLLGDVQEIRHYPSCDMLVVGSRAMLVPMLHAYGLRVDRAARTISVDLPDGFEELA